MLLQYILCNCRYDARLKLIARARANDRYSGSINRDAGRKAAATAVPPYRTGAYFTTFTVVRSRYGRRTLSYVTREERDRLHLDARSLVTHVATAWLRVTTILRSILPPISGLLPVTRLGTQARTNARTHGTARHGTARHARRRGWVTKAEGMSRRCRRRHRRTRPGRSYTRRRRTSTLKVRMHARTHVERATIYRPDALRFYVPHGHVCPKLTPKFRGRGTGAAVHSVLQMFPSV